MEILVVEDEDEARLGIAEALRARGHQVALAANGREALLRLGELPRPCVVLLDLAMPVMDGGELVHMLELQGALGGLSLVAVTARPQLAQGLPFAAVLPKPVELDRLHALVERLCPST